MNDLEINKAVAEKLGYQYKIGSLEYDTETGLFPIHQGVTCFEFNPVRDWENAGPIIEKYKIDIFWEGYQGGDGKGEWAATFDDNVTSVIAIRDDSPLKAAMLCFLAMEVPNVRLTT